MLLCNVNIKANVGSVHAYRRAFPIGSIGHKVVRNGIFYSIAHVATIAESIGVNHRVYEECLVASDVLIPLKLAEGLVEIFDAFAVEFVDWFEDA